MKKCHACEALWEGSPGSQPGKGEVCPKCGADLHCCLNCKLYDPFASNQCTSRTTEPVKHKDKRNFCDEFEFKQGGKGGDPGGAKSKDDLNKKWDDLFK
ncbi:MAG TPA: hypothetical protein VIJ93_10120 [bacterium]